MRKIQQNKNHKKPVVIAVSLALALCSLSSISPLAINNAWSQAAPPTKPEAVKDADDKLEKITVTAQRREQELQSVPLPVSTFTARDLEARNITSTLKVGGYIPNMVAQNNTGLGTANVYFIRGLGNTESIATFDPPVGTYVDDIYIARQNANNFSFFDVERIEVLRGPQGTLFGRNTTGGAMNVILKKPGNKLQGYVEFGGGSFGGTSSRGSVDIPISENVQTKFSYYYVNDDGYVNNIITGQKLNHQDSRGIRGAVLWRLGNGVTWNLAIDDVSDNGLSVFNAVVGGDRISRSGLLINNPGFFTPAGAPRFAGEKNGYGMANETKSTSVSSNINFLLSGASINFITGVRDTTQKYAIDFGNTPVSTGGFTIANDARHKQFTQEIKLAGDLGNLSYVTGVFYMDEKNRTDLGDLLNLAFTGGPNVPLVLADRLINNNTKSTAFYAQGDYKLTSKLTATVGARYTDDKKDIDYIENRIGIAAAAQLTTANMRAAGIPTSVNNKLVTPRFALAYQVDPDLMFFTSATRGFKSGGWNARGTTPALLTPFGIEKVWSYEAGWRASFLDNRLRINGTAFLLDVKDLQTSSGFLAPNGALSFIIQNFAGLRNQGLELEFSAQPMRGLTTFVNVGVQDPKYVDIGPGILAQQAACRASIAANAATRPNCLQGIVNAQGNIASPVRSPKRSINTGFAYAFPTGWTNIRASTSVNFSYKGRANANTVASVFAVAQTITNASISLLGSNTWKLTLDCSNCTNKTSITASLAGLNYINDPRRYSLKLNYAFR